MEVLAEVLDTMDIGTDGCLGEVCGVATPQSSAHVDGSQRGPPSLRPKLLVSPLRRVRARECVRRKPTSFKSASVYECFRFILPYNAQTAEVAIVSFGFAFEMQRLWHRRAT